jgi:putative membrane protein
LLAGLLLSCSAESREEGSAKAAAALNDQHIAQADVTDKQQADAKFLVSLTGNTLLQMELGKLAQARGTWPAVRQYGSELVQSRLALLQDLRTLSSAKQLAIPAALSDDEQAAYHEVSILTGNELDKLLLTVASKAQKQDEDALDDMRDDAYDGDIRGLAAKHLKPVREQLAIAKNLQDKLNDLP